MKHMNVMIVHDFLETINRIKAILEELGHCVPLIVYETSIALKVLAEDEAINLVVVNWNMPDKSGYELAKELRDRGNQTPVLIIVNRTMPETKKKATELSNVATFTVDNRQHKLTVARMRNVIKDLTKNKSR
ncbi:MAG: response regulator [Nanoarchaeota archaeon]|nr:response regulator [Nanoarchaeota archaeon]